MNDCDEIGLSEAIKRLPVVLREPALADFWDAVGRGSIRLIDEFKHAISDTGRSRTVALFHVMGDVFWFEVLQIRNATGKLVPIVRSASLDPLPSKRAMQEQGSYYVV
jgi:hypothetical protein